MTNRCLAAAVVFGVILGACPLVTSAQEHALMFDGQDDIATIPDNFNDFDLGSSLTIEAWVMPTQSSPSHIPLVFAEADTGGNAWDILSYEDEWICRISLPATSSARSGPGYFALGEWHHIACTYDGTMISLYVNGQPVASQVHPGSVSNAAMVELGGSTFFATHFTGVIDEVCLWHEVRSPGDIELDYQGMVSGDEASLVAFWKLDEGGGQVFGDSTFHGNNGWLGISASPEASDPQWTTSDVPWLFFDGLESGDTAAWSHSVP